jgi:hypothetical protein
LHDVQNSGKADERVNSLFKEVAGESPSKVMTQKRRKDTAGPT